MDPTATVARYLVSSEAADLPEGVVHEAKRSLLNWLGTAVGGSAHPAVDIALETVAAFAGPAQASILGRAERSDLLYASFVNGLGSHVLDFDDTHLRTIIHPSGPVAPVLLAQAETAGLSGRALLHAFVLGVEVECRLGNAIYPSHYDLGWHITGTTGVFGAAAAAGKVLGLGERQMAQALGIAATQASGLREMFGTMTKPFHVGNAAKNGLFAALLAARGFTSSLRAIEAPRGFAQVLAPERDLSRLTEGLGESYEILENTYKPFACGIVIHPAIDGCIQLRERYRPRPADIAELRLQVHPLVLELTGKKEPASGLEGKFSVYHSAAVALLDGAAGESQYSDARVNDPEVVALRRKVRAEATPGIAEDEARLCLVLADGTSHELHVEHAIGGLARPMTDAGLEDKFRGLVVPVLGPEAAERLIDLCWDLDTLPDAGSLARAATPA